MMGSMNIVWKRVTGVVFVTFQLLCCATFVGCGDFWEGGDPVSATSMTLGRDTIDLMVGDRFKIPVMFAPGEPANHSVWWDMDNEDVAVMAHDTVVAMTEGTTTAYAVSVSNQLEASCVVNVWPRWLDPYSEYPYDMVVYADITLYGQPAADDIYVGAFWGNELRGVARAMESQGRHYTVIRIWSDNERGDILTFRHYDPDSARMVNHQAQLIFTGGAVGTPSEPYGLALD